MCGNTQFLMWFLQKVLSKSLCIYISKGEKTAFVLLAVLKCGKIIIWFLSWESCVLEFVKVSLSPSDVRSAEISEYSLQNWQKLDFSLYKYAKLRLISKWAQHANPTSPTVMHHVRKHLQTRNTASSKCLQKEKKKKS